MPIICENQPCVISQEQLQTLAFQDEAAATARRQQFDHDAAVIIWLTLAAALVILAVRRWAPVFLRLVNRGAYALGLYDARQIAARWRERS